MADDDTTDRLFPHEMVDVSSEVEVPILIGPSIRMEFLAHRRHIDGRLNSFQLELTRALERLAPEPSPASVARKVRAGALAGGRYAGIVLAVLALLQAAVKAWRPDLAGPIDSVIGLLGG